MSHETNYRGYPYEYGLVHRYRNNKMEHKENFITIKGTSTVFHVPDTMARVIEQRMELYEQFKTRKK